MDISRTFSTVKYCSYLRLFGGFVTLGGKQEHDTFGDSMFGFNYLLEWTDEDGTNLMTGDNINALKWASTEAVTPGNKHVRTAYHWIKEHIRDGDIDLRDGPSAMNLADFLTKNLAGPSIRMASDAASGYADAPAVPPMRVTYD